MSKKCVDKKLVSKKHLHKKQMPRRTKLFFVPVIFAATLVVFNFAATRSTFAQQINSSPARGTYAIRNARIITVSGAEIENGTIVIRDGKIDQVGASVPVPAGAQEIDARGLYVYPGMIDAGTSLGLVEIEGGAPGTVDISEIGEQETLEQETDATPHKTFFCPINLRGNARRLQLCGDAQHVRAAD